MLNFLWLAFVGAAATFAASLVFLLLGDVRRHGHAALASTMIGVLIAIFTRRPAAFDTSALPQSAHLWQHIAVSILAWSVGCALAYASLKLVSRRAARAV